MCGRRGHVTSSKSESRSIKEASVGAAGLVYGFDCGRQTRKRVGVRGESAAARGSFYDHAAPRLHGRDESLVSARIRRPRIASLGEQLEFLAIHVNGDLAAWLVGIASFYTDFSEDPLARAMADERVRVAATRVLALSLLRHASNVADLLSPGSVREGCPVGKRADGFALRPGGRRHTCDANERHAQKQDEKREKSMTPHSEYS